MKNFTTFGGLMAVLAAAWSGGWLQPNAAQAGIGACGDIHVEAEAMCEVVAPGATCEGMCEPIAVRAACAAQLAASCTGKCDDLPSVSCEGECSGDCMAECTKLDPGELDCQGSCEADCDGRCAAHCEADSNKGECEASCQGSCSASCEGSCDVELPEADCDAHCEASCQGSCEADANFDCQADCQAEGSADCEAEVTGGCEVECKGTEGALFCDGQYIDHGDHLDMCIAALRAALDIQVMSEASGMASCGDGKGCSAEGEASAKVTSACAVTTPGRRRNQSSMVFAGLWLLTGLIGMRRRVR